MSNDECPFCSLQAARIFHAAQYVLGVWDKFPVNPGHALIVPKRHIESWFETTTEEQIEILDAIKIAKDCIEKDERPDGYNIGINIGEAGGQTVPHLHIHLIPRYMGDVSQPQGGVRHIIPAKADYLSKQEVEADSPTIGEIKDDYGGPSQHAINNAPYKQQLITGEDDAILSHIRAHLTSANSVLQNYHHYCHYLDSLIY